MKKPRIYKSGIGWACDGPEFFFGLTMTFYRHTPEQAYLAWLSCVSGYGSYREVYDDVPDEIKRLVDALLKPKIDPECGEK